MRRFWLLVPFLLLLWVSGCSLRAGRPVVHVGGRTYYNPALIAVLYNPNQYCRDCEDPEIPVYPPGPVTRGGPQLPASPRDRVPSERAAAGFDAPRARAALSAVDLSSCREQGAPRGYGHAIVTYSAGGFPLKVLIDDPGGLSHAAVQCVGERLGGKSVAPFEGPATEVGVTWFIR